MALCDSCMFYDKKHDEFRQQYDDTVEVNGDKREKHYCPMYDDYIPYNIFYDNGKCEYYQKRDGD